MPTNRLSRRNVLTGGIALATLTACGGSSSDDAAGSLLDVPSSGSVTPDRLGVRFPDGFRAASIAVSDHGPQRFPFVIVADDGFPMINDVPESIDIQIGFEGTPVSTETVAARGVGQFTPYYPLEFTPEQPGRYTADVDFSDLTVEFIVQDPAEVSLFQVGDPLPAFDTPTFTENNGVETICTRTEVCPFHELTLTEAVANDKPTVLLISTPEFCQTDVCGPSLEFLIEAVGDRTDLNVIHAEVYADPRNPDPTGFPALAPLLEEWQVAFEPSLFVADASNTIVRALHFAMDRDEVAEAVSAV